MLSSFTYNTHSAVHLAAQSSVVGTLLRARKRTKKARSGPKSSDSSSATPAANRAAVGVVGSCCRPLAYTTYTVRTLQLCILRCNSCAAGIVAPKKMSPNVSNNDFFFVDHKLPLSLGVEPIFDICIEDFVQYLHTKHAVAR